MLVGCDEITGCFCAIFVSNCGSGASGGRTFVSGNHPNSLVTKEGLTIIVIRGNVCDQTVRSSCFVAEGRRGEKQEERDRGNWAARACRSQDISSEA